MGTINSIRLININYNNGGIKISDETLYMNGINTLVSLQNGGGKSVLVQLLTSPFVHKAYRRARDRSFEGYFTGTKPSFILVEWTLGGSHKMMNGFMVHRRPEETSDEGEDRDVLDIIGIVSEYSEACPWDINNLQVVEKSRKEVTLKSFVNCKQLFESFKKDRSAKFFMYDMGQGAQQRQYFEKLKEYKVDFREWENIIKKVNQKEGGLADLFSDCKDEKGLTEKWLLDAVEKKLDPDGGRIRDFGRIIKQHSVQCYENEDKIKRREDIRFFREKVAPDSETPENTGIKALAEKLKNTDLDIREQENRLVCFLEEIRELSGKTESAMEIKQGEIDGNYIKEERLKYEKYSREIHELIKEKEELEGSLLITSLEIKDLKSEFEKREKNIRLLETRRVFDEKQEEYRIREKLRSDLDVARKENEDLKPRREELGKTLHGFYLKKTDDLIKKLSATEEKISRLKGEEREKSENLTAIDEETGKLQKEAGKLQADIESFNRDEEAYQKVYGITFTRNILGKYEDGALYSEEEGLSAEKKENDSKRKAAKERKQKAEIREKKLESDLSEKRILRNDLLHKKENLHREMKELDRQKKERLEACVFAGLSEEYLYDRESILRAFEVKVEMTEGDIRLLQEKENRIRREKEALESGRIAEIPSNITEGFGKLGIDLTFGMEWLLKNDRPLKYNLELVRKNPFLPYSLIISDKELERLKKADEPVFTEMPLPLILRQDLEKGVTDLSDPDNPVVETEKIRFYVRFNENLLDPDKLKEMIDGCAAGLKELKESIEIRKKEKNEFIRYRETVRSESLTGELVEKTTSELKMTEEEIDDAEKEISSIEALKEENSSTIEEAQKEIEEAEKKDIFLNERLRRLKDLIRGYERYLTSLDKKYMTEKELNRLSDRKKLMLERLDRIREEADAKKREAESFRHTKADLEKKLLLYAGYSVPAEDAVLPDEEMKTAMEAEYEAIIEKFSGEIRQLEKEFSEQEKRYRRVENHLLQLYRKNELNDGDLKDVIFSGEELDREQGAVSRISEKITLKEDQYHREDKEISVKGAYIGERIKRMKEETGQEEVLNPEEIPDKDFNEELAVLRHERANYEKELKDLDKRQKVYRELINSLDEYDGTEKSEEIIFDEDFSVMDAGKLHEFRGIMRRDMKRLIDERQKRRNRLSDAINDLILLPVFRDDFYRKPLEAMFRTVDSPEEVLRHIGITLQSYDDLMAKIEVDLSVIEDERKSIQNELLDYIRDINGELDKIDSNSAIPVRNKTIKMLTISIPSFPENEEIYRIRIKDYLEVLVKHCMELCRHNQNMDEYTGTKVNVRELYDTVIGINNVHIRLYKIEREREYPISWAEVSKNSGGEGFLSSFVILSSLLHYMRRDENDLFADRNEGKVLLMDNPFGVTYSEHLLKPLMELAAKNNTQLICFSGLGGDAIYGRFDNIYVLNLIAAGLKNGVQYLRSEHIRGSEPEVIVASHIEVLEQMTLF